MSNEVKPADSIAAPLAGAQFLEALESKHTYVLDELDALNARIESVLKMYVESRQTAATVTTQPAAVGS